MESSTFRYLCNSCNSLQRADLPACEICRAKNPHYPEHLLAGREPQIRDNPTFKGTQLVIDAAVLDDLKAKNYTPQQLMDLSFLP